MLRARRYYRIDLEIRNVAYLGISTYIICYTCILIRGYTRIYVCTMGDKPL